MQMQKLGILEMLRCMKFKIDRFLLHETHPSKIELRKKTLTLCSRTHSIFPFSLYVPPLTLYSTSHSMFTHSLYIPPLILCSHTHSIFPLSLYVHPLTRCLYEDDDRIMISTNKNMMHSEKTNG